MKIAILGATSQIAKDLIVSFSRNSKYNITLFARYPDLVTNWLTIVKLSKKYLIHDFNSFSTDKYFDVIINFVGIGDPVKTKKMGNEIFKITEQYDEMSVEYLKHNKKTKYIFLSSGAVYGGNYKEPVHESTLTTIDLNNLGKTDWYTIAKLYTEAKHRSLADLSIIDVRVFNYFSHTQDMNARFLITDMVRAIKNEEVFKTSSDNIMRDFITPPDFYNLIQAIIDSKTINTALDCYTKSPVSKFELLSELENKFGLSYEIDKNVDVVNATGTKINYYSVNKVAEGIGYNANSTSLEGIIREINSIEL